MKRIEQILTREKDVSTSGRKIFFCRLPESGAEGSLDACKGGFFMRKNVGTWDAIMRITIGLVGLAWSSARMARHPYRGFPVLVAILSGMKVAEGITRFCPMLHLLGTRTNHSDQHGSADEAEKTAAPYAEH